MSHAFGVELMHQKDNMHNIALKNVEIKQQINKKMLKSIDLKIEFAIKYSEQLKEYIIKKQETYKKQGKKLTITRLKKDIQKEIEKQKLELEIWKKSNP